MEKFEAVEEGKIDVEFQALFLLQLQNCNVYANK